MLYLGIVEDVEDPLKANRVKVRIFFLHTQNKSLIPTTDLFWSSVGMPATGASHNEVGQTHGLIVGSHVYGIFLDKDKQNFFVMGSYYSLTDSPKKLEEGYPKNKATISENGHTLQLNDGTDEVILSHGNGNEIHFFSNDDLKVVCLNDYEVNVKNNDTNNVNGDKLINVGGRGILHSDGDTVISSGTKIVMASPAVIINPTFGFPRAEFQDTEKLPSPDATPFNGDLSGDHPDAPNNSEVLGKPYAATICAIGETKNMYDFLMSQIDLDWREKSPPDRNPNIKALFDEIGFDGSKYTDNTAWCAVTLSATLKRCGYKYIRTMTARDYTNYGTEVPFLKNEISRDKELESMLTNASKGDILVFSRGGAFGHVGVYSGEFNVETGKFGCLGGNQGSTLKKCYYALRGTSGLKLLTVRKPVPCAIADVTCNDVKDYTSDIPTSLNPNDDFQMFVRNLYHEDRGDPDDLGIAAVAHVVINRKKHGDYPTSYARIVSQPDQFSWYNAGSPFRTQIPSDKTAWERCIRIAKSVICGETPDPTNGSTLYYAKGSMSETSFRKLFSKEIVFQKEVGLHRFFTEIG